MRRLLLAAAFLVSICGVRSTTIAQSSTTPVLTRVLLGSGSFNTAERNVTLALTTQGSPTAYRASENRDFTGAAWRTFSSSASFTLSSGVGGKVVFVQVGRSPTISSDLLRSTSPTRTIDYVVPPTILSNVMADTIVYGLPDLRSEVTLPSTVRVGNTFEFVVRVINGGQMTPPGQVIEVYNSFVTNSLSIEHVEVNFGTRNLVGEGCVMTAVPTIE